MPNLEKLSLANVIEGRVDREFQARYPEILSKLKPGQKATYSVSITIQRPEGSTAMANLTAKSSVKMPPAAAIVGLYPFNNDYQIQADPVRVEDSKQGIIQFPNAAQK